MLPGTSLVCQKNGSIVITPRVVFGWYLVISLPTNWHLFSRESPLMMKPITYRDDIARMNRETFAHEKREGKFWTIPWLDLDVEAYRRYREGELETLPMPYCDDPADRLMMAGVFGKKVLCLAGGGGHNQRFFRSWGLRSPSWT